MIDIEAGVQPAGDVAPGVAGPGGLAHRYDVFLSYSRKDEAFAVALERALRAYAPPKDLAVPQRRLTVFRDQTDMQGVELTRALDGHLRLTSKLIVLCSPDARASTYVNQEIASFVRTRGAEHCIPVLVRGLPNNEARPGQEGEMAFPEALTTALVTPLAADFRGLRPRRDRIGRPPFAEPWHKLLADVYAEYGVSRAQIEERERRRQARRRAIAVGITTAAMLVLFSLTVWALVERREAIRQRNDAVSRQLAHQSTDLVDSRPDTALLLAAAAYQSAPTLQARRSLQASFIARPRLRAFLWGHSGDVSSLAFSPDGRMLAMGGEDDGKVTIVDTATAAPRIVIEAHSAPLRRVAFHPDGMRVISAGRDDGVRIWDAATGALVRQFAKTSDGEFLETFALSPDGRRLVTADWSGTLALWDVETGGLVHEVQPHSDRITAVLFNAAGTLIASGGGDGVVALWDGSDRHPELLPGHGRGVQALALSQDGSRLAVAYGDAQVRLWSVADRNPVAVLDAASGQDEESGRVSLAFAPDARFLARAGALSGAVTVWDLSTGERSRQVLDTGSRFGIHAVAFSHGGTRLGAVGGDGGIRLWSTGDWTALATADGGSGCLAFSPDDAILATCGRDRAALWEVAEPKIVARAASHRERVGALRFSPDGAYLASASDDRDLIVWDPVARREVAAHQIPMRPGAEFEPITRGRELRVFAFSADGRTIATGGRQGASFGEGGRRGDLLLWNFAAADGATPLEGHPSGIAAIAFSPDGRQLAAADGRGVRLWDVTARTARVLPQSRAALCVAFNPAGTVVAAGSGDDVMLWDLRGIPAGDPPPPTILSGHDRPVRDVLFAPDGLTLISSSFDGTARIWTLSADLRAVPGGVARHDGDINSLALAPDGRSFATGSRDRTVGIWDTRSGAPRRQLTGHAAGVQSIAFSAGGEMLASAADDGSVIVWDVESGREIVGFRAGASLVAFSPRDPLLAMAGQDGQVTMWDLAMDAWPERACRQANRNFTCEEWRQYMPDLLYRPVCPSVPAPAACDM